MLWKRMLYVSTATMLVALGAIIGTAVMVKAQGIPDAILGCVGGNGNLRVIEATDTCRSNETALEWNIEGLPGPEGPPGPIDANSWKLVGNSGTGSGTNFIGTTDNQALELHVNTSRALIIEPNGTSPNLIGGYFGNSSDTTVGATIGGGGQTTQLNTVRGNFGAIGGGSNNLAGNNDGNQATAVYAAVGGGLTNRAMGSKSTVSGGSDNTASDAWTTVGGGSSNNAQAIFASVGGGCNNNASGEKATIGGGCDNTASADSAIVGGGNHNGATASSTTVGGGNHNVANNTGATVGGGSNNGSNNQYSTVAGGNLNTASGAYSTIPGGAEAKASSFGQWAYASGRFSKDGDAQASLYVLRNTTDDETITELFLDGISQRIVVEDGRTLAFDILVVGSGGDKYVLNQITGLIQNRGGTVVIPFTPFSHFRAASGGDPIITVVADVANKALVVNVKGLPSGLKWVANVRTAEVAE